MDKIKFRSERCKGCGLCVIACPKDVLKIGAELNRAGYPVIEITDMESCTSCTFCAEICPDVVISVFKKMGDKKGGK
ncbi:MAG: 4Fe-4S dicluster domain-containing protein [Desulfobacterales bacterium]|nr:4Fe-4S dicluster domain-containing protein [Desulfobacterales bacterium]MCP4158623.1 4Fe-4S dicluster domain-containing protein [Deltaproteobacteria bacterium]